jgi:formate-dependent phosphoribosylglycinamide formyltransferase (GAR transformylase)
MKKNLHLVGIAALGLAAVAALGTSRAAAQDPVLTPIIVDTALPIIVNAVTPKPKDTGLVKFQGFVMHANAAQLTVRAQGNDMAVRTFALSQPAATKMQQIIDKGGYQYGDKVTVYYDAGTHQVLKIKGKPSRPL